MKFYSIIFLQFLFICASIHAQKGEPRNGYIIDNEGNRVEGFVQSQKNDVDYEVKIRFKETKKAKKYATNKVEDFSAYGFEEIRKNNAGQDYVHMRQFIRYELDRPAKLFTTTSSFIELEVDGELQLYKFLYDTPSDRENPVKTRYIVLQNGQELAQIEKEDFDKSAKALFKDYTVLAESIGESQFKFQNFARLVNDYNYWLENKHDPTDYKLNPSIYSQ